MPSTAESVTFEQAYELSKALQEKISLSIFGQEELITEAICCLLSGGHILMTGAPGLAKTTLVRVFAKYLSLNHGRIQFTPDLLPTDILGSDILNIDPESGKRSFEFSAGPVFVNLLLADEINRASPRTQSALLEAMQERTCTVGGTNHQLPQPFMVFATQNPFESEGAFPLPEAQLDRFLIHTLVRYPSQEAEERILTEHAKSSLIGETLAAHDQADYLMSLDKMKSLIDCCRRVRVDDELIQMINRLVRSSRPDDETCPKEFRQLIWYGAGPRAGISLISVSRAFALMNGSEQVRWEHVKRMAKPVLRHRIRLAAQASRDQITEDHMIDRMLEALESNYNLSAKGLS
ncbi:AAA family ATPase [Pseudobacteriovorax antillogorgiicola]|uniref:MoxR-like ATPase n=1 Tax=Pseudobacteriovorax antillogorgiicola TaxID=1513793 RepID=A0A1Y6CBV2_9BACT|nr:AAA family ATPase [Pseudobacteriovorax antillogorgiicola]TCS48595.1 MoxR-like ATPase [Pseudobacteriovorax antillogorgiicola]SMF55623.1 MoxR-like ATPase [Pseudobacteriovorax antillogorgiicola]